MAHTAPITQKVQSGVLRERHRNQHKHQHKFRDRQTITRTLTLRHPATNTHSQWVSVLATGTQTTKQYIEGFHNEMGPISFDIILTLSFLIKLHYKQKLSVNINHHNPNLRLAPQIETSKLEVDPLVNVKKKRCKMKARKSRIQKETIYLIL